MKSFDTIEDFINLIQQEIAATNMMSYIQKSNSISEMLKKTELEIKNAIDEITKLAHANYKEFKDPELAHSDFAPMHKYKDLAKRLDKLKNVHVDMLRLAKSI